MIDGHSTSNFVKMNGFERSFGFERLRGRENFSEWKVGARAYLTSKGHYNDCITSLAESANATQKTANERALAELTLLLDPSLYSYIWDAKQAKEAWDSLIAVFEDKGAIRKVSLLKQWISLKSDDCSSVHDYVNKNVAVRAKVKNAGFNISDEIAGCILLCGLSEKYDPLIMSMEAKDTITLDSVKNMLLQTVDINSSSENAMSVKKIAKKSKKGKKERKPVKCYECDGPHFKNKCPNLNRGRSEKSDIVLYASLVNLMDEECEQDGNDVSVDVDSVSDENFLADSFLSLVMVNDIGNEHSEQNNSAIVDLVPRDDFSPSSFEQVCVVEHANEIPSAFIGLAALDVWQLLRTP